MELRPVPQGERRPEPAASARGDRRTGDRRVGDRRRGQAATLHHRRATDVRVDAAQSAALLARRTMEAALVPPAPPTGSAPVVVDLVERVLELPEPEPQVRCPECGAWCDRLWLVRHVVEAHPGWA